MQDNGAFIVNCYNLFVISVPEPNSTIPDPPWDLLTFNKQQKQPQVNLRFPTSSAASVTATETFEKHTMPH